MAGSLKTALVANILIAVMKFILGGLSGSKAMISEGYHSVADSFNQLLLVFGISRSKKAPDITHQFGYAKNQFFWSFIVAIIIFGISGTIAFIEGLEIIKHPDEHELHPEYMVISIIALLIAIALEGYAFSIAYKEAIKYKEATGQPTLLGALNEMQDPVLNSVLAEDFLALIGLVVALVGITLTSVLGMPIIDGYTSLIIGIILGLGGLILARENKTYLIGIAVNPKTQALIKERVLANIEVKELQNMKTMLLGPKKMILALEIEFKEEYENTHIGELIDRIEKDLEDNFEQLEASKIFIEAQ